MEKIWQNLEDPSWWFTGIFFVLVGLFLTKLVFNWIPFVWSKISVYIPTINRKFHRWHEKRVLIRIKITRQKDMRINWLIGRYWAMFLFCYICMGLAFIYFAVSENVVIAGTSISYKWIVLVPLYALMISVGIHKRTLFRIMNANHRWKCLTNKSRRDRVGESLI
ncbi:hypothetical protein [Neptuniibacter sp.]|uniref:hypothetical protein n=1 Tax=Neptuniibacter sp. TaxID=1962643 RepID=UPI0026144932|nr:hypothetical protein [Neptuniibacter sp.]